MDKLQVICKKTRYFWALSRLLIIACFAIAYSQVFAKDTTLFLKIFMTLIFAPPILSMIYIQIVGLTKSQKATKTILIAKILVAAFTTFFSFLMVYVLFFEQKSSLWMLLMILWMFLFAAYEFITSQKPEEIDLSIEIDEIGQTKN